MPIASGAWSTGWLTRSLSGRRTFRSWPSSASGLAAFRWPNRLSSRLSDLVKQSFPVGTLDITLYRDDLSTVAPQPLLKKTEIDFDLNGRTVLLCDDVLYTGRTIRAALDGVIDLGRPRAIRLAVLIDRGHRELPIEANYVGKSVPTSQREVIQVLFEETDAVDEVWILERPT